MKTLPASTRAIAAALLAFVFLLSWSSCTKNAPPPTTSTTVTSPLDKTLSYLNARCTDCSSQCIALELVAEPNGTHDTAVARNDWRAARHAYETIRFAVEQIDPTDHQKFTVWFDKNPQTGFHWVEKNLFVATPDLVTGAEPYANIIGLAMSAASASQGVVNSTLNKQGALTTAVIFQGLHHMIADIDTFKLSGLDSMYSNNSYTDVFSNLEGIDSVYAYFQDSVRTVSTTTDTAFTNSIANMRQVLTTAGSLQRLDKNAFRSTTLQQLQAALANVAKVFGVAL